MYSDAVRVRFMQPQYAGSLTEDTTFQVTVGAQDQGALIKLYVAVDAAEHRITHARFKAYGCGACIATADYLCESLTGLTLSQLEHFDTQNIANALELPSVKLHCIWLASEAVEQLSLVWRQAETSLTH